MELRLQKERFTQMICVVDRVTEDAFTSDVVVPDTLPDVSRVLLADGDFCLWRLDLTEGSAEAEGEWKGSACYQTETDNRIVSFPITVGVRLRLHDDAIRSELRPFTVFRVTEVSVQMMNSRKLRVKVRISFSLQGYASDELELTTGFEEARSSVFSKLEPVTFSMTANVEEQLFTVGGNDELRYISADGILASHSEIIAEDTQITSARAVLRGSVATEILYLPEGESQPVTERLRFPFSQLLDLERITAEDSLQLRMQLTDAELTCVAERSVQAEYHVVAQLMHMQEIQTNALTDAYGISGLLTPEQSRTDLHHTLTRSERNLAVACDAETEAGDQSVIDVLPYLRSLQTQKDGLRGSMSFLLLVQQEDGKLRTAQLSTPFDLHTDASEALYELHIVSTEAQITGGKIKICADLSAELIESKQRVIDQMQSADYDETVSAYSDTASLTLVPKTGNDDLWSLAKKYGSSIEAIADANASEDGESDFRYLLIPSLRLA